MIQASFTPRWTSIDDLRCDQTQRYMQVREKSSHQQHGHDFVVHNIRWNVKLNHDFFVVDGEILNYDFIQRVTEEKVANFWDALCQRGDRFKDLSRLVFLNIRKVELSETQTFSDSFTRKYLEELKELQTITLDVRETNCQNTRRAELQIFVVGILVPQKPGSLNGKEQMVCDDKVVVSVFPQFLYPFWTLPEKEMRYNNELLVKEVERCLKLITHNN